VNSYTIYGEGELQGFAHTANQWTGKELLRQTFRVRLLNGECYQLLNRTAFEDFLKATFSSYRVNYYGRIVFEEKGEEKMAADGKKWFATHDSNEGNCGYAYEACSCNYQPGSASSSYPAPLDLLTAEQRAQVDEEGFIRGEVCRNCIERG
jgi:hypothetical protein